VGAPGRLDIATWNIENFPQRDTTPELLADLIASMELDLIALEEVASTEALTETVERLRDYDFVASSHTYSDGSYQKIAYVFRRDLLQAEGGALLFTQDGFNFPRPPLKLLFTVRADEFEPLSFNAVAIHLKAGGGSEDRQRRQDALASLEGWVRSTVDGIGDPDVVVLGDFNEKVSSTEIFAPFVDAGRYTIRSGTLSGATFLPGGSIIDHVVTTASLDAQIGQATTMIPRLDELVTEDQFTMSDHLPVVLQIPLDHR
jgi:endonuclease/exonuclease/phosphatase family metal-dependent hydrolase